MSQGIRHISGDPIPNRGRCQGRFNGPVIRCPSVNRVHRSGDTTQGVPLPGFGCQNVVTTDDVNRVSGQLEQSLARFQSQGPTGGALEPAR